MAKLTLVTGPTTRPMPPDLGVYGKSLWSRVMASTMYRTSAASSFCGKQVGRSIAPSHAAQSLTKTVK